MTKIILTTESGSDVTKELGEKYNVQVVSFGINFPDRSVNDVDIDVQEVFDFYKQTKKIPKTNAVSPFQYTEFFEKIAEENPEAEIVHVGYSSACSCAFQNALIGVADCTKAKVYLVDSLNVSGGLANLVYRAREIIDANPNADGAAIKEMIEAYVSKIKTSFVPDRLEFLVAGGRVSNAAGMGANLLKIKPRIDIIKGQLIAGKKYMGIMKKVAPEFIKDFTRESELEKELIYLFFAEGADMDTVEAMKNQLLELGFAQVIIQKLGVVMTVHGGRGAIGVSGTLI